MDLILEHGDELYNTIPHQHRYVDYTELPKELGITSLVKSFSIEPLVIMSGYLISLESSGALRTP